MRRITTMAVVFFILAVTALVFASCGQQPTGNNGNVTAKHSSVGTFYVTKVHDGSKTYTCVEVIYSSQNDNHVALSCNFGG